MLEFEGANGASSLLELENNDQIILVPSPSDSGEKSRGTAMNSETLPLMASIADTVKWSGVSRSSLYELIAAGKIEARKAGAKTLVVTASVVRWLDNLPQARGKSIRPAD
jgi:hypothetical protein